MAGRTLYTILGVSSDESAAGIRAAYRDLARRLHPDVSGAEATPAFQDVGEAYRVLSDPALRRRYDLDIGVGAAGAPIPGRARAPRPEPLRREPVSVGGAPPESVRPSVDALHERFARNFTHRHVPKAERAEPLNVDVLLTPEEARRGVVLPIGVPVFVACPSCGGAGRDWLLPCARCDGEGVLQSERFVRIATPAMARPGSVIEVPLAALGVGNLFLRLRLLYAP